MATAAERTLRILLQLQADVGESAKVTGAYKEIQTQATATAAAVNAANTKQFEGSQVWQMIAAQRAGAAPVERQITAEVERRRGFLRSEFEIATALVAGDTARAAVLRDDLRARQLAVVYEKQLVVSEAEALQLARRRVEAENQVAAAKEKTGAAGRGFGLINVIGLGAIVGGAVFDFIAHAADEAVRLAEETAKTTDELIKQVREWNSLAKAAGEFSDTLNLGEKVEPQLNALAERLQELRQKEITGWETVKDFITQQLFSAIPGTGPRLNQEALDDATAAAQRNLDLALKAGNASVDAAEKARIAWENVKLEPLSQAVVEYSQKLDDLKAKQSGIDRNASGPNFAEWLRVGAEIQQTTTRLQELTTRQTKLGEETEKVAAALRKVDFGQLDSAGKLNALDTQVLGIQARLQELGVAANTPNEALEKAKTLTPEIAEEVIRLAGAWGNVIDQVAAVISEQAKMQSQLQALNDQLAVSNAAAFGTRDDVFKAEWGKRYNEILAQRQRIGADTSAQAINDQIYAELIEKRRRQEWAAQDRHAASVTDSMREQRDILHEITSHKNAIADDPFLTLAEKNAQLIPILLQEAEQLRITGDAWGAYRAQREATALTFGGTIEAGLISWVNQLGTIAQQTTQIITGTMTTAIGGASQAITGLLFQTKNLGQAAWQTFQSIVQQLIQMGIQMLVTATLGRLIRRQTTQEQTQANAQILASATPAAVAQTGASAGSNWVLGAALAAVAVGAIIALLAGGFAEGGRIPGPLSTRDNRIAALATGETIINAPASAHFDRVLGRDWYSRMNNFRLPARMPAFAQGGRMGEDRNFVSIAGATSAGAVGEPPQISQKFVVLHDKRAVRDEILKADETELYVVDVFNRNVHRIRKG